jgi:hypothetical protein
MTTQVGFLILPKVFYSTIFLKNYATASLPKAPYTCYSICILSWWHCFTNKIETTSRDFLYALTTTSVNKPPFFSWVKIWTLLFLKVIYRVILPSFVFHEFSSFADFFHHHTYTHAIDAVFWNPALDPIFSFALLEKMLEIFWLHILLPITFCSFLKPVQSDFFLPLQQNCFHQKQQII